MKVSWSIIKTFLDERAVPAQFVEFDDKYWIKAIDGSFELECELFKVVSDTTDLDDFEANYKPAGNKSPIQSVLTQFERTDIVLKLAKASGQADANGDLVLNIPVPGAPGEITRYVAGGYGYVDPYAWDSAATKVEVVDVDNIFGYGANAVLKEYHDSELPAANQGWFFERSFGTEASLEIEPMGWYGELRGGLYLKVTFKVEPNANVKIIVWWGKKE